ncbi:MAG TPA: transposase [Ktedonobacterales bacterium]|nr:transposase [Ktedonobacterales bacterium]
MLVLPSASMALLVPFTPLFSSRVWRHIPVVVAGALLAPGRRMISSVLRAVSLTQLPSYQAYHRVLNRAVWSSLGASRILFGLLVATFAPAGPLVVGIDETIERRRGHLPRSGALESQPLREGARPALDLRQPLGARPPSAARVWALPFL